MFGMNLREYRKLKGLTQEQLAELLSESLGENFQKINIGKWETGTNPKIKVIIALAEILEIPEQYLFDDKKEKINKIVNDHIPDFKNVMSNLKKVPLIDGYVGAGSSCSIQDIHIKDFLFVDIGSIKKAYLSKDIKAIEVIGDSMTPYVNYADLVLYCSILKGQYNLIDGKYIIQTINGIMVKNLSFKTNGNIIISSTNTEYPSEEINSNESQEHLDIIGIVVGRILKS